MDGKLAHVVIVSRCHHWCAYSLLNLRIVAWKGLVVDRMLLREQKML